MDDGKMTPGEAAAALGFTLRMQWTAADAVRASLVAGGAVVLAVEERVYADALGGEAAALRAVAGKLIAEYTTHARKVVRRCDEAARWFAPTGGES